MTKAKFKRIFAFFMAINIFAQVAAPTAAFALTSGPGQPEMASFEPVGTTEMVDVFSGDFNYNIPLLTVPGPNGGYPINLAYHAGIGMDDEASWVGLGWNINPGTISRDMRGLPDDFNGDQVIKEQSMKPNRTVGVSFGLPAGSAEVWGFKFTQNMSFGLAWNNYQGIGYNGSFGASIKKGSAEKNVKNAGFSANINMSYNSLAGETSLIPSFSYSTKATKAAYNFGLSAKISSLSGLKDLNFSSSISRIRSSNKRIIGFMPDFSPLYEKEKSVGGSFSASTSFASSGFVPTSQMPQTGFNVSAMFSLGIDLFGYYPNLYINADYDQTKNLTNSKSYSSYGYLYSEKAKDYEFNDEGDNDKLMDFNREKDAVLNKDIPSMPAPVYTHDLFMVKGQGTGGMFRAYREDISLLRDPEVTGDVFGGAIGVEMGAGYPTSNFGVNTSLNYSRSYSGPWQKKDLYSDVYDRTFQGSGFYFKSPNDICASETDELNMLTAQSPFPLTKVLDMPDYENVTDATSLADVFAPCVDFRVDNNGVINQTNYTTKRGRSQFLGYRTVDEINEIPGYKKAWVESSITTNPTAFTYNINGHQVAEMSMTNADGNRYIYALPAVNKIQRESTFSIDGDCSSCKHFGEKIIDYTSTDNSTGNSQLDDNFYSSTTLPAYAHNYMLTAIVAPDYVDLTGDGPSDDDFGYWVKFKYDKYSDDYLWRAPFNGANLLKGYLSTNNDDKAGLTHGVKEIWYLNSIETKTHIAKFTLSDRKDGYAANAVDNNYDGFTHIDDSPPASGELGGSGTLKKVDKISLYSKNDLITALKEVNLDYDYSLCSNVWNNENFGTHNGDKGKLTLKSVSFSYLGNTKGTLSPYMFNYGAGLDQNPDYTPLMYNRWGTYQPDKYGVDNTIYPYVFQRSDYNDDNSINDADKEARDNHASAWNLREIILPSGGTIKVSYEADDYAIVHEKKAMEMVRVLGFGTDGTGIKNQRMSANNSYLYFELDDPSMDADDVHKMIEGIDEIYFNIYTDLKKNGVEGILKKDYVDGYAKIDPAVYGVNGGYGYIRVEPVPMKDVLTSSPPNTHPFRKAGWQYLRLERKDVLFPGSSVSNSGGGMPYLKQVANATIDAFKSTGQLFMGYYNFCATAGYCDEMNLSDGRPSFIRLNCHDGRKYGGGHRVKKLTISDSWQESGVTETESNYGQEYQYVLPDGTSSGVAAYEPLLGGEEIPYRKPIRYSSPYFIFKNKNLYMEEPVGESYYPAGSVGYSRVIVKNVENINPATSAPYNTKTKDGKTVYEYYTTKDFPFSITRTTPYDLHHTPKFPIPFIGSVSLENHAYTQSMEVRTNDMHGRLKSVATYHADADLDNPTTLPVTKTEYIYNTINPYSPNSSNYLSSTFDCLFDDGVVRNAEMGVTHESFIDNRQNSSVYMKQGVQTNMDVTFIIWVPTFYFNMVPIVDYAESMYKSMVKMQVHSHTGVLTETRTFTEGSTVVAKNLLFDANSGKPLLTTVTNNFDKPVYTYEHSAAWTYPELGNAYKNDRAVFEVTTSPTKATLTTLFTDKAKSIFCAGDQLLVNYTISGTTHKVKCWVKEIQNKNDIVLIKEDGSVFNPSTGVTASGYVIQSGYRNQQSVSNAAIVSLTNPVNDRVFYLFDGVPHPGGPNVGGYNNEIYNTSNTHFTIPDCSEPDRDILYNVGFAPNPLGVDWCELFIATDECKITLRFDDCAAITTSNWRTFKLKKSGNKVYATNSNGTIVGTIDDKCGVSECLDGVLQATASEFKPLWEYDYLDVGNPSVKYDGGSPDQIDNVVASTYNPYRIGTDGIWKVEKTWAYQTARKQSGSTNPNSTKIQKDGTFEKFILFDWSSVVPPVRNKTWTNVNTVTKYSPYGYELENKNAIDISSSAIYGYNNSVQTGITANSGYYEAGFDGFEDYTTSSVANTTHGHVNLVPNTGSIAFASGIAHTGSKSLQLAANQSISVTGNGVSSNYYFRPVAGKKYVVSAWFKAQNGKPNINLGNVLSGSTAITYGDVVIEGWQKIEASFECTSALTPIIQFSNTDVGAVSYLDDIRIQPFKSTMKTFVYDPNTLWLLAELDNQNYATLYNYDEEGTLTQVKKETVKGIQTLKTTRSNIRKR